ncbi:MAG: hypothetical protein ABSF87_18920 [Xanthobacteraceae bacterium]|jgi:protein-L-isoaspartate O-methyltransferase
MASSSQEEEILETAIAGIPRVAQVIAAIPREHQAKALEAAESSYRQTVLDLGYEEAPTKVWVAAVMFRLRAEVEKQGLAKQKGGEVLRVDFDPDENSVK